MSDNSITDCKKSFTVKYQSKDRKGYLLKIDSSIIGMESARSYASIASRSVSYQAGVVTPGAAKEGKEKNFSDFLESGDGEEALGETNLSLRERFYSISTSRNITGVDEKKAIENIKMQCMQYLIYWLFGGDARDRFRDRFSQIMPEQNLSTGSMQFMTVQSTMSEYYAEAEQTAFSTTGKVVTADGREISFNVDLSMSRSFEQYYETSQTKEIVQMMDPLVINLDTDIASLSDQKFEFDIDNDGILDSISMLQKGSGYLALDKNGDGTINDGSELFGTSSGDGFYDLSMYDEDGNGWIDENDEIFSKLLIWSKDENGNDELYHLKDKGVGAICLQKVATDFSLNSLKTNQTNGQIRSTGVFLYENGTAGTMQQMDLAI